MPLMAEPQVDGFQVTSTNQRFESVNYNGSYLQQCKQGNAQVLFEIAGFKKISSEHYSFQEWFNKVNYLSQDTSQQLNTISHYSFIREASLNEPDFWLTAEFNPPDPTLRDIRDSRYPEREFPWYLAPPQPNKLRLAGWRDSNCLYRCKLRFHI